MNPLELEKLKALYFNANKPEKVSRSYHKGRRYRIQQIFNDKGFVVKQIIHVIN